MAELLRWNVNNDPIGVGYEKGGGSATQATSKSTTVALDAVCGAITMNAASLAAAATVGFTLTNALIEADDLVLALHKSAGTAGGYRVEARTMANGSCAIQVTNITAGALAEAIVLAFMVLKGTLQP